MKKWLVVLILCGTVCTVCGGVGYGFGSFSRNPRTTLQPPRLTPKIGSTHYVLQKTRSPVVHLQNSDILDEARKATVSCEVAALVRSLRTCLLNLSIRCLIVVLLTTPGSA
jgi:hypothetical protein